MAEESSDRTNGGWHRPQQDCLDLVAVHGDSGGGYDVPEVGDGLCAEEAL
jgi:hypothetical protein